MTVVHGPPFISGPYVVGDLAFTTGFSQLHGFTLARSLCIYYIKLLGKSQQ